MERTEALALLGLLHEAQNQFYGGSFRMHRQDILVGESDSIWSA